MTTENDFIKTARNGVLPDNLTNVSCVFSDKYVEDCGYGYITKSLLMIDNDNGVAYDTKEIKGVFKNGNLRCTTSRNYTVIPDELIESYLEPLIDEGVLESLPGSPYHTKNGLATTWEFNTREQIKIQTKANKDDIFDIHAIFRNSLKGNVALSATVRTLRLECINGLTGWGEDITSKLVHYGNRNEKIAKFNADVKRIADTGKKMVPLFQNIVKIPVSQTIMEYIINKVGLTKAYIPEWINVQDTTNGVKVLGLNQSKKPENLYEAINDITWKLSRANKSHPEHNLVNGELEFPSIIERERKLTYAIQSIIANDGKPST